MQSVAKVIANLRAWRALPGYSVERRFDVLLSPWLAGFLRSRMGDEPVELVTAEFPIPKRLYEPAAKRGHVSADFLCLRGGRAAAWILVELKTDVASKREKQDRAYQACAERSMSELLGALKEAKSGTEHEQEYTALIARTKLAERRARVRTDRIELCYIEPKRAEDGPSRTARTTAQVGIWRFGLGELARFIPAEDPFGRLVQMVLRGIARSEKARRTKDRRRVGT